MRESEIDNVFQYMLLRHKLHVLSSQNWFACIQLFILLHGVTAIFSFICPEDVFDFDQI